METKRAMVLGASGLIGKEVVRTLLSQKNVLEVYVLVRSSLDITHPKLRQIIGDYSSASGVLEGIQIDELYSCIGTTKQKTPDTKEYYQIDHDYPVLVAQICKENGAKRCSVVSSVGASSESKPFYLRTKGEMERDLIALNYDHTLIFRPSLLIGKRDSFRLLENLAAWLMPLFNPLLIGKWKQYRSIEAYKVAKAMVKYTDLQKDKIKYYTWESINKIE
jgi:uncharacterized protein YbjT (DUF2867 family)